MRNFKKTLLISILLILAGILFADEGFYIKNYDFKGTLLKNNVLSVTETINVEFLEYRHGIYRAFPDHFTVYRFNGKEDVEVYSKVDYENVCTYGDHGTTSSSDGQFNIKIGDADTTIIGDHTYTISYDAVMPDDYIDVSDFFFYSILGAFWDVEIKNFTFNIDFEKPFPEDTVFHVYSGSQSNRDNDLGVVATVSNNTVYGEAHNIMPNNAITLYADFPADYFEGAKKLNSAIAWILAIIAMLYSCYVLIKAFTGGPGKKPVATVEFYPPKGITPADIGYIIDSSADDKDIFALIPYMAQKGYLTIKDDGDLILYKKNPLPNDAPDYMKSLYNGFFESGNVFDLGNVDKAFATPLDKSKGELANQYKGDKELFTGSSKAFKAVIFGGILSVIAGSFTSRISYGDNFVYNIFMAPIFLFGVGWNMSAYTKYFKKSSKKVGKIIGFIFVALSTLIGISFICSDTMIPEAMVCALYFLHMLASLSAFRMIKMTDYNIEIAGKLKGLKEFIRTAELPKLEYLMKENPNYYYDILPYAMAFGLGDKWANKFESLSTKPENPAWYAGNIHNFSPSRLSSTMDEQFTKAVSAARPSESSGGSSSGGFSGGGGGGGGGGSW